jgi:hypothetical protein
MLSGKPLFPGRDYHHQLTLILDVLGTPTLDEFYAISTRRSRDYIRALPFRKKRPFATLFPNANPQAVDFLTKTLVGPLSMINLRSRTEHEYRHLIPKSGSRLKMRLRTLIWKHMYIHIFRLIIKRRPDMLLLA